MKALSVHYNTPDLLDRMLSSFRKFYDFEMLLVDGSDGRYYQDVENIGKKYIGIEMHHFDYNIHHGPGIAYGFSRIADERIIVIDSDIVFINPGIIERMDEELLPDMYGIGDIVMVNKFGDIRPKGIKYLHPAFMLVNKKVVMEWPMPIKHGAPMIETMIKINKENKDILQHAVYVTNELRQSKKIYIYHDWRGTVSRTGGSHLSGKALFAHLLFLTRIAINKFKNVSKIILKKIYFKIKKLYK
jgi:glycosyltransferase involved in cell wall biosynthesis